MMMRAVAGAAVGAVLHSLKEGELAVFKSRQASQTAQA
jgi:hypothetical protein